MAVAEWAFPWTPIAAVVVGAVVALPGVGPAVLAVPVPDAAVVIQRVERAGRADAMAARAADVMIARAAARQAAQATG